ncbi:MAG: hypothetical protein JJV89_03150, partial [Desulfosarcina sp.]|nr:hypothetical protein [Desulfobacterales bacterium]
RNAKKDFLNKVAGRELSLEKIHAAAIDYLNTRFLLKGGVLTSDEIHALLIDKGLSSNTASIFKKSISSIESIIFTGAKRDNTDSIRDELIMAIKSVEREAK